MNCLAEHLKILLKLRRRRELIIRRMIKILNLAAFDTARMMMVVQVSFESLWTTGSFHHRGHPDCAKCVQGAMDGIKGDCGKFLLQGIVNPLGGRMFGRVDQFFVNQQPLWGEFDPICLTLFLKQRDLLFSVHGDKRPHGRTFLIRNILCYVQLLNKNYSY